MPGAIKGAVLDTGVGIVQTQGVFSGQLRASTNVNLNSPDLNQITVANYVRNAITRTSDSAKGVFKLRLLNYKPGDEIWITNNKDYAGYDEYKHGRLSFNTGKALFQSRLDKAARRVSK